MCEREKGVVGVGSQLVASRVKEALSMSPWPCWHALTPPDCNRYQCRDPSFARGRHFKLHLLRSWRFLHPPSVDVDMRMSSAPPSGFSKRDVEFMSRNTSSMRKIGSAMDERIFLVKKTEPLINTLDALVSKVGKKLLILKFERMFPW